MGHHSLADISKAQRLPGYAPTQRIGQGLKLAMPWYIGQAVQTGLAEFFSTAPGKCDPRPIKIMTPPFPTHKPLLTEVRQLIDIARQRVATAEPFFH